MEEMEYTDDRDFKLLASGKYKDYEYYIISFGTHPCAYVKLTGDDKYYHTDYEEIPIECHGGLTYSGETLEYTKRNNPIFSLVSGEDNSWVIGWDYAHYDDCIYDSDSGRRWATAEMVEECENVIRQLIVRNNE